MKYLCIFVLFAICLANCLAAIAEPAVGAAPDVELDGVVGEKKTEKRGIYGFGYGHYGHGGYGGYGGHGHAYGGYGGYGPYYGGYEYVHHAAPYYGHHGVYPYHHGHYGFY